MISIKGNNANYEGTSADTKPAGVPVNTIFRELDTNCYYYYTGEAWVEIPGGGGGGGGGTDSYNDLENKPQINNVTLSGNKSLSALGIQGELTFDSTPTEDSTNPVESGGVYEALTLKQNTLTIDSAPTENSTNPVESGGVYTALGNKQNTLTFNGTYNASTNPAATVSTVTGAISTAVSNLTKSDVGLDNVTNNAQIKAVSGGVTAGDIVTFGSDGATVQDSGKAVETTLTDSNNKIPTSKSIIDNAAGAEKLTGYSADTGEETIGANTTVTGAIEQLDYRTQTNKTNILLNTNEIATLREITNCKLYGVRIDKQDTNPDTRVTYIYDAVGMTPAYMDFTGGSFNYGSWGDIWFIAKNRPVALKFDGTVDYELSHTDFTKKIDGETASDVSDSTYGGNFMSEIPLVYVKRWEDTRYNYIVFSETKPNDDYLAQAHTNANGTVNPYIYLPMFKGWKDSNNKLRSLMGTYPTGNTTGANEVTYAENCGNGWQLWDKAKIDLIMDLIVLITKSTNCRGKIGNGDCNTYNASDTTNYGKMKSGYETDGTTRSASAQFYGSEGTDVTNYGKHHMIAFYIEDLWANRWDRCLGFNLVDNVYKVKMTAPYALDTDSSYTTLAGINPPSATDGWLKNVSSGVYGDVPTEVGASNTTGFANYFYKNASGNRLSLFGGDCYNGLRVGRCWLLLHASASAGWGVGGSPCFNAL